jgi:hypothetical protein
MRQISMRLYLCVVVLTVILPMVGCTDGGSQAEQEGHASQKNSDNVKVALRPDHDSGVSGTASIEDIPEGVLVKLKLRGLPKPNEFYLAHIHPGTCVQEAEAGQAHTEHGEDHQHGEQHEEQGGGQGRSGYEHGTAKEIEYPLSQVKADSEGQGSSTIKLGDTSVDRLFSAEPKYVNVHEAGSGNPPILSCVDLKRAG